MTIAETSSDYQARADAAAAEARVAATTGARERQEAARETGSDWLIKPGVSKKEGLDGNRDIRPTECARAALVRLEQATADTSAASPFLPHACSDPFADAPRRRAGGGFSWCRNPGLARQPTRECRATKANGPRGDALRLADDFLVQAVGEGAQSA